MHTVKTIAGSFDQNQAQRLKNFVLKCDPNIPTVTYEGQEYDLRFLKYLVEFLETHFSLITKPNSQRRFS